MLGNIRSLHIAVGKLCDSRSQRITLRSIPKTHSKTYVKVLSKSIYPNIARPLSSVMPASTGLWLTTVVTDTISEFLRWTYKCFIHIASARTIDSMQYMQSSSYSAVMGYGSIGMKTVATPPRLASRNFTVTYKLLE